MAQKTLILMAVICGFRNPSAITEMEFYELTAVENNVCSPEYTLFQIVAPSLISCLYQCARMDDCLGTTFHLSVCYGCNTTATNNTTEYQAGATTFVRMLVPSFKQGVAVGQLNSDDIDEASGLAASHKHPGMLYTHNDSEDGPIIYILSTTGEHLATLTLENVTSNDWEDISIGVCDGSSTDTCVYIGDIGYGERGSENNIYRFPEPDFIQDQTITIESTNKLEFSWGVASAEVLMVDPDTNVYIIEKARQAQGEMVKVPNSAWGAHKRVHIASTTVVCLPLSQKKGPVAGDISPNGNEVLIKTHAAIYYWNMAGSRDYAKILQTNGTNLPYIIEPNGDSVCWDLNGKGYFTTSENRYQPIYYYERLKP